MVFGVFDSLHDGHKAFLKEAKSHGEYLIAVLPPDEVVEKLKGRLPKLTIAERFEHLRKTDHVDAVIVGDHELGSWNVLENHRPTVIALGYDQDKIKEELRKYFDKIDQRSEVHWKAEIRVMKPYKKRCEN